MPFRRVGKRYKSPQGRMFTKEQVISYYVSGAFKRPISQFKPK